MIILAYAREGQTIPTIVELTSWRAACKLAVELYRRGFEYVERIR